MYRIVLALFIFIAFLSCGRPGKKYAVSKFRFEKIVFHTSLCFGTCPAYHLEVNNDKIFRLIGEHVFRKDKGFSYEIDSARTGFFTGVVSDTGFNNLTTELECIGADSLHFDSVYCCDASLITMIIYYNGKRKFLKSMFPPEKAQRLIAILYDICNHSPLKRSEKEFALENEK